MRPMASQFRLICAVINRLALSLTPASAEAFGKAGSGLLMAVADLTGASSNDNEIWLPEVIPLETDQSGRCDEGNRDERNGSKGRLISAKNQIRCRVAAAARRQTRHNPPAKASTTKLFS